MSNNKIGMLIFTIMVVVVIFAFTQKSIVKDKMTTNSEQARKDLKDTESQKDSIFFCSQFYLPFKDVDRDKYKSLKTRIIGKYGDYRSSPLVGHLHAGIDMKGDFSEIVYPIGVGQVVDIFRSYPNKTVVIKHFVQNSDTIHSVYTHVEDVRVNVGDWITENIPIAQLFTEEELKLSDFGTLNHIHLEIRNSIQDGGRASWSSMSMSDLNKYCMDPLEFYNQYLSK